MQMRDQERKNLIPTCTTISSASQKTIDFQGVKKPLFGRKKQGSDQFAQKDSQGKLGRKSREGRTLHRDSSIDRFKSVYIDSGSKDSIKYLSPHFTRTSNFTSPPQKSNEVGSQKFIRKPVTNPDTFRERFIFQNRDESKPADKNHKEKVEYSLESILTKNTEQSELDLGSSNWFALQAENEILRRQKERLEREVQILRELLNKANIAMPKVQPSGVFKHSNCFTKQSSILGAQTYTLLQLKTRELEGNEQELISKLKQQEIQTGLLRHELLEVTKQLEIETMAKFELLNVVETLRMEISRQRSVLQKNVVKQDMLLRKKAQFEGAQKLATKADRERQNFKKAIGEYKLKIQLLTGILAKNHKKPKDEQISLDLSMSFDSY